jgi:DNA topoisomerase IB
LKGKEFKGGEFIPSEGGYQEEYKKQQKAVPGKGKEEKKERTDKKKPTKKMKANKAKVAKLKAKLKKSSVKGSRRKKDINAKRDKDGKILMATGKALPEHLQNIAIPPAWKTFIINPSKKSKCWVVGFDEKGKINGRVYSPEHVEERGFKKDSMLSDLNKNLPKVWKQIGSDMSKKAKFQKALIAKIMILTGARVGSSEKALGQKGLTYGVSTLEGRHVVPENGAVKLDFIGKDSKQNVYRIRDEQTVKMLLQLKKNAGNKGRLFNEKYADILDYVKNLDGGGFTPKSFRTRIGTDAAIENIQKMKAPTNPKEYKKAVKAVAKQVAEKLNNTPTIALKSYIVPSVWQNWKMEAGVE